MVGQRQRAEDQLGTARLVADTTCALLRSTSIPDTQLLDIMRTFREIATGETSPPVRAGSILPAVIAAVRDADLERVSLAESQSPPRRASRWRRNPIAAANAPPTPVQRLAAALQRSPIRLDDRCAMAVARASGKAVGRDLLEQAVQVDDCLTLTFGFQFGSAKFAADIDIACAAGDAAIAALMKMLEDSV